MHILVTGVTGFVGSRLAERLVQAGHTVTGIKRRTSSIIRIQQHSRLKLHDVEDGVSQIFNRLASPLDAVIHTATQYGNTGETYANLFKANVLFPADLLTYAISQGVRVFVNTDTFFCKASSQYEYLQNYVKTKQMFREIGKEFAEAAETVFINLSLEHVYGPGDGPQKFVTRLLRELMANKPSIALTEGSQRRDFVFVDDVAAAAEFVLLNFERLDSARFQHYEIGTGVSISLRDFVKCAKEITRSTSELRFGAIPYREHEIMESKADQYALQKLGWHPKIELKEGLLQTINSLA